MSKKSVVALAHSKDVQENVTRVFDMLGGVTNLIEPNSTVVLKPNAGHAAPPEFAVCTHPETVRAVIREVRKANPKRIVIAESAAVGCDTMECYEACGIAKMAAEEGVELYDIKREKDLVNVAVRGYRSNISHVKLPKLLLEAEHIINLPILKAHASMVFSGALKNIKGVVQDQVHTTMHRQNLTMAMMDVWSVCKPDLNIMDVMSAASGYSPHTPTPIELDCVMGSKDPVALDRIACELVGIDPDGVSYFKVADEVGLGTTDQENIEVVGDKIEDCYKKMLRGRLLQLPGPADPEHGDPEGHRHLRREQGHDRCGRLRQQAGSQHPRQADHPPRQLHPPAPEGAPRRLLPARLPARRGLPVHDRRPQGGRHRPARADALDPPADGGRRPRLARLCGEGGCQVLWNRQTLIRAMCSWTTPRS